MPFYFNVFTISYVISISRTNVIKFSSAFVRDYVACYGFDTIEKANECKKALDEAFAGVDGVLISNVRDVLMEKVQKEIEKIESEPVV